MTLPRSGSYNRDMATRKHCLFAVLAAAAAVAGCNGAPPVPATPPPPPTIESDLALLTLAAHHEAAVEEAGELKVHAAWLKVPEAYARFRSRGPAAIPELMQQAKETPPFTWAALEMIAGILRHAHPEPFQIARAHPTCAYWVMTWAKGQGVSRITLKDVDAERDQALAAFESWLLDHGYLKRDTPRHYDIRGSSVFPIKRVLLGSGPADVVQVLGKPGRVLREVFQEPAIVRLEDLPAFDEQWHYPGDRTATWVFFREMKVVAAFQESLE